MSTLAKVARFSALSGALALFAPAAGAAPPTKEECVDAHGKGQDARDAGQLAQAAALFLTCAQPACPALVQSDCARFVEELQKLQPTVTFAARDGAQNDLSDTAVYVDGVLVASRLGDGKTYDISPGPHTVRFLHDGKEVVLDVVVNQGEKGRGLVATFASPSSAEPLSPVETANRGARREGPKLERPKGPLVLLGLGTAAIAAGGVLAGVGISRVPANCSLWTHECAAAPKDPVFEEASRATTLVNLGAIVGGVGAAAFGGSLIWYLAQPLRPADPPKAASAALLPWLGPRGAGVTVVGAW